MDEIPLPAIGILSKYPQPDERSVDAGLADALSRLDRKIVVLDDDPTGVQTVHDISVYTDWSRRAIESGFAETNSMFFILTNSRSFTSEETKRAHAEMAENIAAVSKATGKKYLLVSRSDSTLRGHFPLETATLCDTIGALTGKKFDGEIIAPFFKEGGRFTIDDVHYVREGDSLVPAGQTEFARDRTFGYRSSHLGEWVEEKTGGLFRKDSCISIRLEDLRSRSVHKIARQLDGVHGFNKVIVNAIDYIDIKVFMRAFIESTLSGKDFIFRSGAAVTKIIGGVADSPLLSKDRLIDPACSHGGIVLIGSHVNKTTRQFEALRTLGDRVSFIEFNQHLAREPEKLQAEALRVTAEAERVIGAGKTAVVYTRRERFDLDTDDKEAQLLVSVRISDAVTGIVSRLKVKPSYIIAKGGITSSDVGTKALGVRRATVMGQIKPGIPVWMTGGESKFPFMPYVIFPGNVGETDTLAQIVDELGR
jgi:uncharacterized protein YgbK (DUF1537 family)